ncbi:MAG: acyl-CoA dehydrogenase, partial [bacterium]|nr:acyl-CoA dehydrogenase [bacterium]
GAAALFVVNSAGMFPLLKFLENDRMENLIKDHGDRGKLMGYALSGLDKIEYREDELITYEKTGEGYILSGKIDALLMGDHSTGFVVLAGDSSKVDNTDLTTFYIPSDMEGVKFGENKELIGLRALPVCSVELDNCILPADNIVGKEGKGEEVVRMTEAYARILSSAQCLGVIRSGLRHSDEFGKQRKQFGTYIGEFQALQDMMTDMQLRYFAGTSMLEKIMGTFFDDNSEKYINCAMLKLHSSSSAMKAATDSVQIFGGYGFMRDYPVEKLMRDAKTLEVFYGNTHHLNRILAGNL